MHADNQIYKKLFFFFKLYIIGAFLNERKGISFQVD